MADPGIGHGVRAAATRSRGAVRAFVPWESCRTQLEAPPTLGPLLAVRYWSGSATFSSPLVEPFVMDIDIAVSSCCCSTNVADAASCVQEKQSL